MSALWSVWDMGWNPGPIQVNNKCHTLQGC